MSESAEGIVPAPVRESAEVGFRKPWQAPVVIGTIPRLTSDPRGLPSEQIKVADSLLDGADLPALTIRGASLRGDAHRYNGVTRQDALSIYRVYDGPTEAYLACVADGVGSEPLSQYGSANVCELAHSVVGKRLTELFSAEPTYDLRNICNELVAELSERLIDKAVAEQVIDKPNTLDSPAGALSTTFVAAVVNAESSDPVGRQIVVFAVGDSPVFVLRADTFIPLLSDQHDTEIASSKTMALPTRIGHIQVVRSVLTPGDVLLICTDGLSNPMRSPETSKQLASWWGAGEPPSILEFGWQLSFKAKSYDDDRSAVCFWNK
jgi:serine/threonine protein phosphatase PrpC